MSIELLERAAEDLVPFLDDVVFVGGATVTLWMTDPAAAEPRPTKDVDVVVEVASRGAWHDFEARLRAHGLQPDATSPVICRWRGRDGELLLDVMPSDASLLGFENRWQLPGLDRAVRRLLPSARSIRAISPPYLLATKLEAWNGRGRGDHLRSHDLEDIILLVDGRSEIIDEVAAAPDDLRAFVAHQIALLLDQPRFLDALDGTVVGFVAGSGDESRVDDVLLPRFRELASG